jgi:uncharacterized protein (DUF934 family)
MQVIRHREIHSSAWRQLPDSVAHADGDPVPADDPVVVSLTRLLEESETLLRREGPLGVLVAPADDVRKLEPFLSRLASVSIDFPVFNDGRGYSQARLLRGQLGFRGELRAVGDIGRDQLAFLERCGFDVFALRAGESPRAALAAFSEISLRFQTAEDAAVTVASLRQRRAV